MADTQHELESRIRKVARRQKELDERLGIVETEKPQVVTQIIKQPTPVLVTQETL